MEIPDPVNADLHLPTIEEIKERYDEWKLTVPPKEELDKLARSKQLKWKAGYLEIWKTEFPWMIEVKVDGVVKGVLCGVCRERVNDISIDASKDVQLKKSGGKFITVPFAKFGDLYEAAKVHEFGSKGHLNHRDSQGNPLSINVIRKQIEQGVIQAPKTTHMNYHLQLHSKNVAVQEDNTVPVHLFRLNKSLAYENQQAYEVVIAMLHRLVKRRDAPFASLKDKVLLAVEIMKCEYLKRAISEAKQGIIIKQD